ncbi:MULTISPECIES: glycerophosphodiester phosphodiesterase [unclassified Lactobacillus]|uniref:glycerophosphodiester phosphodiesterase n=1 Tax=unclassified Lactobacillus TaxID=2620435 RepID=UPI0018DAF8FB|nr:MULTISPECIES: glycerophosphodiester phosphodiesterase [unclassified Lactobacillus]MBH9990219.1 glycerophosphodiester phosphodiesterase [Lactobacillus sp. M0392]MBI0024617.1 glycerophosphodiester phosphodiesterase [Lactobacillus sp. W8171]MBI0045335.1 glycerophosphodiester phosphodiesterase [Lactobacillus sp. M0393]
MKYQSQLFKALIFSIIFIITSGFTVVGHRGDPSKYPEETIQSDNSAFNSGADYVELDLRLSADGELVVSHDDDLFRVTHTHAIVSQNYWQALSQLTYDNGEHVLSLPELFEYYQKKPNTKFILETKIDHGLDPSYELEDQIAATVKKYHMEKRIMIHSFSAASLFHFRKIMPDAYLILIVGSLKRMNFSNLPQVNAVNVSSDLILNHSWLIHWLHQLNKQVYVWTEMDESPDLWQWLINKNVDGVVTNFPSTGFKYKLAKEGTKKYAIHRKGSYFGKKKAKTMMNPYVQKMQNKYVYPGQKFQVMYGVRAHNQLYYQIANQTFISAEFVNMDLRPADIAPYQSKQIIAKPQKDVRIYRYPDNQAKTKKLLPANTLFKIQNFNGSPKSLWLFTSQGWIKARDILFYGFFDDANWQNYRRLPRMSRYSNIALTPYLQLQPAKTLNTWQKIKQIKKITTKKVLHN